MTVLWSCRCFRREWPSLSKTSFQLCCTASYLLGGSGTVWFSMCFQLKASMDSSHNQPIFYTVTGFLKQYRKAMIQRKTKHQLQVIKHLKNAGWIFFPMFTLQRYPKALDFKTFGKIFFLLLKHQLLATAKGMKPNWWTSSLLSHGKSYVPLM